MEREMDAIKQTFTMPPELNSKLRKYCEKHDLKFSQVIRQGLKEVLKNE